MRVAFLGLGYRADFFVRALKRIGNVEIVGALVRTLDSIDNARKKYDIKGFLSKEYIADLNPDFIINTASKAVNNELSLYFLERGIPVLQETPVGLNDGDIERMRKYKGLYQIAEQYKYYDFFECLKKNIDKLGNINEVVLSYAHDYHGISILRHILGDFKTLKLNGKQYTTKIAHTKTRYDDYKDGMLLDYKSKTIFMEWDNIKVIYDFNSEEYRSTIRSPYIIVRGSRGEIVNNVMNYLDENNEAKSITLDGFGSYDDNTPVERVLLKMMEFVKTKKEFYPIEYAIDDAKISIIMNSFSEELNEVIYNH